MCVRLVGYWLPGGEFDLFEMVKETRVLIRRQSIQKPVRTGLYACGWWWQSTLPIVGLATQPPPGAAGLET